MFVLGSAPNSFLHEQNSFVAVASSTCTSRPITASHVVLGHERCAVVGGDLGGVILYDLALRYPGFVERICVFNTLVILRDELFAAAGIPPDDGRDTRATADYFRRQGQEPDALLAELDTPARRR